MLARAPDTAGAKLSTHEASWAAYPESRAGASSSADFAGGPPPAPYPSSVARSAAALGGVPRGRPNEIRRPTHGAEALHRAIALPCRLVGVLHPVVQPLVRAVFHRGHHLAMSDPVGGELVGDHHPAHRARALHELAEEPFRGGCVPPVLVTPAVPDAVRQSMADAAVSASSGSAADQRRPRGRQDRPGSCGTAQQNAHAEDVGEGELPNHDS